MRDRVIGFKVGMFPSALLFPPDSFPAEASSLKLLLRDPGFPSTGNGRESIFSVVFLYNVAREPAGESLGLPDVSASAPTSSCPDGGLLVFFLSYALPFIIECIIFSWSLISLGFL